MVKRFLEQRRVAHTTEVMAGDIARYAQVRQHLGPAIVLCDEPEVWAEQVRRHWLKLSRELQRRRSQSGDIVELLKYTYTITQMQHMHFIHKPSDAPESPGILFVSSLVPAPVGSALTLYVTQPLPADHIPQMSQWLGGNGLVIDYTDSLAHQGKLFVPREQLEATAHERWGHLLAFMEASGIAPRQLRQTSPETMDAAIDELLDGSEEFLRLATTFARALELARPLEVTPQPLRAQYETVLQLAQRIQAMMPYGFSDQFLKIYADDTRLMHDRTPSKHPREGVARALQAVIDALALPELAIPR